MKNKAVIYLLSFLLFMASYGCDYEIGKPASRQEKIKSSPTINIGVVWPLNSNYKSFLNGIAMASDEINLSGGVLGKKLNLKLKDDESNVTKGMMIADELSSSPEICAAIGFCDSYVTIPVSYIYDSAGILMVTTATTVPGYNSSKSPLLFRTVPGGTDIAKKIAEVINRLGYKKTVLCYVKDDYGLSSANACEDELKRLSISVVDRRPYVSGSTAEFKQITDCWKLLKFDCAIIFGDPSGGPELINSLRNEKISGPIFCGDTMNSPELIKIAGDNAEGVIVSSFFNISDASGKAAKFVSDYKNRFGALPDSYSVLAYDTLKLLAEAIKRSQTVIPIDISKAMHAFKNEEGIANSYNFDEYGDVVGKKIFLKIVSGKKFLYLNQTNDIELINKSLAK